MQKKWLFIFGFIFLIGFVSAQYSSLSGALFDINSSTVILAAVFILTTLLVKYSLRNQFRGSPGISLSIALIIGFLAMFGINSSGLNYGGFLDGIIFSLGLPPDIAYTIFWLVIWGFTIFIIWRVKPIVMVIGGIAIMFLGSVELIPSYVRVIVAGFGVLMVIVGILKWIYMKFIKEKKPDLWIKTSSK